MPPSTAVRWCIRAAAVTLASAASQFGQPVVTGASAKCASVEFTADDADADPLKSAYVFAKQPEDPDFGQWGHPVSLLRLPQVAPVGAQPESAIGTGSKYHALIRDLPVGARFHIRVSESSNIVHAEASPTSEVATTEAAIAAPEAPSEMQVHRTDLRVNKPKHDGSVCVDLEWSHRHMKLTRKVDDVYFRVLYQYKGEDPLQFCEDEVGSLDHACGEPLAAVTSALPSSFATVCGLRPQRWIRFTVQAFTCDTSGVGPAGVSSQHVEVILPTSAPSVVTTLVTQPANQESVAGFHPKAVLDWIPQNGGLIAGHAVYLALVGVDALKLLCWVPHEDSRYAKGHLEMPIKHKNHTYSKDTLLLQDYLARFAVHHEQEVIVTTRTKGHLESPAYFFRLGEWLVMEDAVKCLTSFEAKFPCYVDQPRSLAWTQEEALSLYD